MDRIKHSSKRKTQNAKVKKIFGFSIFLLLIVFCLLFIFWWKKGWNGKDPTNIVISSGPKLWVLALRPKERRIAEIEIPETTVIHGVEGGTFQAKFLWKVSELEHNSQVIALAGTDLLEVPVDDVIRLEQWNGIGKLGLGVTIWRQHIQSIPELLRLYWFTKSLRANDIVQIDMSTLSTVRSVVDPGGAQLLEVDNELLSLQVVRWFEILEFRESPTTVAVMSSQQLSGIGAHIARELEHSGLRVISVKNGQMASGIYVRSSKLRNDFIVERLSKWFHKPIIVADFDERSDILVVQ